MPLFKWVGKEEKGEKGLAAGWMETLFNTMWCLGGALFINKIIRCARQSLNIVHLVTFIACMANEVVWISIKHGGKQLIHTMSSFNFIFCSVGSVCLLNEVSCNFVIFGNNSNHRDQYGYITMVGTHHSSSTLLWYTQELILIRGQHGCKRQIQLTAAILKSNCLSANSTCPKPLLFLLLVCFLFKWNVRFEMKIHGRAFFFSLTP